MIKRRLGLFLPSAVHSLQQHGEMYGTCEGKHGVFVWYKRVATTMQRFSCGVANFLEKRRIHSRDPKWEADFNYTNQDGPPLSNGRISAGCPEVGGPERGGDVLGSAGPVRLRYGSSFRGVTRELMATIPTPRTLSWKTAPSSKSPTTIHCSPKEAAPAMGASRSSLWAVGPSTSPCSVQKLGLGVSATCLVAEGLLIPSNAY